MFLIDYNVKIAKMSKKQENIFIITFFVLMLTKIFTGEIYEIKICIITYDFACN